MHLPPSWASTWCPVAWRVSSGALANAVRVGVASDEGPLEICTRADVVVDGPAGLERLLTGLTEAADAR